MGLSDRTHRASQVAKISDALRELHYLTELERPEEIVSAYRELVPRILSFAEQSEDKELIKIATQFATTQKEAESFYNVGILQRELVRLRNTLGQLSQLISSETMEIFLACISKFQGTLADTQRLALSSFQRFEDVKEQLIHRLVGSRLEKEVAPDLAKKLGYIPCPNIIPDDDSEVEVDFLGEKNSTTSAFGTGRLKKKAILIIEVTATISKNDIARFLKKLTIIRSKYEKSAHNFRYELEIKAWLLACYGWTEELRKLAEENDVKPFGKEEIIEVLRENNLLDRRIPICP